MSTGESELCISEGQKAKNPNLYIVRWWWWWWSVLY